MIEMYKVSKKYVSSLIETYKQHIYIKHDYVFKPQRKIKFFFDSIIQNQRRNEINISNKIVFKTNGNHRKTL